MFPHTTFNKLPPLTTDLLRHFGTGIILAAALCHLLANAVSNLTDPCVGNFRALYAGAWVPFFILLGILFTHLGEFIWVEVGIKNAKKKLHSENFVSRDPNYTDAEFDEDDLVHGHDLSAAEKYELNLTEEEGRRKYGTFAMLFGLFLHLIVLGLTIGVVPDARYTPLICASVFFLFFVGIAFGIRLAQLKQYERDEGIRYFFMATIYALTAAIACAIGIGVQKTLQLKAYKTLVAFGILEAIAAGILLYIALVHLIEIDITRNRPFRNSTRSRHVWVFVAFWLGVALMLLLAKWAVY